MPHENINLAKPFGKGDARFFVAQLLVIHKNLDKKPFG